MARCTVPRAFGLQRWFDTRFLDLCLAHDAAYMRREGSKWNADWQLARGMIARAWRYLPLACVTWIFCTSPIGWWFWLRR